MLLDRWKILFLVEWEYTKNCQ